MKIKLIQSGGFMGRTKVAEEEAASYPPVLQQHLENIFAHAQESTEAASSDTSRDAFSYFVEYNGKLLPLQAIKPTPEFDKLLDTLKGKLHY